MIEDKFNIAIIPHLNELKLKATSTVTYSDTVKQHIVSTPLSQSSLLLQPKNTNQTNNTTKSELLSNINPVESNIKINNVKSTRQGGVVIRCNNPGDTNKIHKIVTHYILESLYLV